MSELEDIDNGKAFDWGKTSEDYGKYRDIYPESYFNALSLLGITKAELSILDIGTGTGVIARKIYNSSLSITGIDIEENQIEKAKELTLNENKRIEYFTSAAESTGLKTNSFDFIIAAQCYIYFDIPKLMKEIDRILKPDGKLIITWFCWLPFQSKIAKTSEDLILKYNPDWKGAGFKKDFQINFDIKHYDFILEKQIRYEEPISFSKESWAGRIRATRGVGAVLTRKKLFAFNEEHIKMLNEVSGEKIKIPHLVLINSYKRMNER